MSDSTVEPADASPVAKKKRRPHRPWPMTAVALLLFVEALGFAALDYLHLVISGSSQLADLIGAGLSFAVSGVVLAVLVIVCLFAILGNLSRSRNAWMLAMLVQGAGLAFAIALYFGERPFYTYLIMLYGLLMVIYLLMPGVQAAFLPSGGDA